MFSMKCGKVCWRFRRLFALENSLHCVCFNCNTIIRYCVILLRFFGNLCLWNVVCSHCFFIPYILFFFFFFCTPSFDRVSSESVYVDCATYTSMNYCRMLIHCECGALPTVKRFKLIFHSIDHSVLCSAIAQCDCNICTVILCQHSVKRFQWNHEERAQHFLLLVIYQILKRFYMYCMCTMELKLKKRPKAKLSCSSHTHTHARTQASKKEELKWRQPRWHIEHSRAHLWKCNTTKRPIEMYQLFALRMSAFCTVFKCIVVLERESERVGIFFSSDLCFLSLSLYCLLLSLTVHLL